MKNPSIMVLLPLLMTLIFHVPSGNSSLAPAFYIFGDSLLDNGNNNPLPTQAKVNFLPYGMNLRGGVSTGRFTNGRTSGDFIAAFLGLPSPPPYSSLSAVDKLRLTPPGTNFASGSCGILPETGNLLGKCFSLDDQINFFEAMAKGEQAMQPDELSKYLSNSIFLFNIGANDYLNNYLNPQYPSGKLYTPQSYAQHLNEQLSLKLQRMYNLGARKFVVFEIGAIGCTPGIRLQTQHESLCNEDINKLPQLFNENLALILQNLTSTLEGSAFTIGQINSLGYDAIFNPSHYGLTDSTNSCCTKISNNTGTCMPGIENACQNPNDHYFFDAFHPTESLYKAIALRCFHRTSICKPNNIRGLVQLKI